MGKRKGLGPVPKGPTRPAYRDRPSTAHCLIRETPFGAVLDQLRRELDRERTKEQRQPSTAKEAS